MGSGHGLAGYRYSPPQVPTRPIPTPGTPPPPCHRCTDVGVRTEQRNSAVGLRSVAQLTLYVYFSGFLGMTEVYNLAVADNPNDQKYIPGFK